LKNFMFRQFRGCTDSNSLNQLSGHREKLWLAFWYMYYHIRTNDMIFYTLFNLVNQFSNRINLCIYGFDYSRDSAFEHVIPLNFDKIEFLEEGYTVTVRHGSLFTFALDFENDILTYDLQHESISAHYTLKVTDWNTNQGSFLPQFQILRLFTDIDANETDVPGEWMVDSPAIGDVVDAKVNGRSLGTGQFWFDTYTGTNYHYLAPYTWFYVHTPDWMIYILQYGELNQVTTNTTTSPILIKDLKNNKWYVSGAYKKMPQPFEFMRNMYDPMTLDIHVDGKLGDGPFKVEFKASDIQVRLNLVPGSVRKVFKYMYYDDKRLDSVKLSTYDRKYLDFIQRISFEEYLCDVDVTVSRDGKDESFRARSIYEGMTVV